MYVVRSSGRSFVYNRHRWLWVPACAETTQRETCSFAPIRRLFDNSIGAWRSRQLSPMHNVLRDHAMDTLGAVDGLGHAQIRGQAAKRIGVLARQGSLLAKQR